MGRGDNLVLEQQLCIALNQAARAINGCYRPLLAEIGLTYGQYTVLLLLWEHEVCTSRELSDALHLDSGTLSPLLQRMDDDGLIERQRAPEDERLLRITLTDAGRALEERAMQIQSQVEERLGLSAADVTDLRRRLERLTDHLLGVDAG